VAAKIVASLGRTGTVTPDRFGRFLRSASAWMGRAFATTVIGKEMKKMSGS